MKIRKLTATFLAVILLATLCCGVLLSCGDEAAEGNGVYTITFNANGGTVNPTSAETTGGKLASLPTPSKANTEFLGWYISSEFAGKRLTVDYKYSFSCLVHAKWGETQSTEYTVTFDANGGTLAAGTSAKETVDGRLLALPADPIPPVNSTFLGWFTEKAVGEKVDLDYEFTGDTKNVTLYAHYQQEYVITFDAGEGKVDEKSRVTVNGKLIRKLPTPTEIPKETTFIDWYTKKTDGKRVKTTTVFTGDSTIYAAYLDNNEYIVTLDANGGTLADGIDEMFTTDKKLSKLPADPTPPKGYQFVGWFTAKTAGKRVDAETTYEGIDTIYAQYILVEFIVSFVANGGKLSESSVIYTEGGKLERMPYRPFAPSGKKFVGWFTEKDGGEKVDLNYVFRGTPSMVKLFAHYEDITTILGNGLWMDESRKGEFKNPSAGEVWAYAVDFTGKDVALEIWYNGEVVTNVARDKKSTPKVVLSPDKMLRLADGADISNSIINVLYRFESNTLLIQEIIKAEIKANDGIYIGTKRQAELTQNLASAEVMAEKVVIGTGGTKELTVVYGGKTVEIAHFGMESTVRAQLAADKKNVIIAAGTYSIYYNYGATDPTSNEYKNLWIEGRSTGNLPQTDESLIDSPYYMVGSSATLGLSWTPISSVSLIPDNIHLRKTGDKTYAITVNLYSGNEFKILKAGDGWEGAYDYSTLSGNSGSNTYFKSSSDGNKNVVVITGGNYTLTIDTSTRKLSFVRNGEAEDVKVTYDICIYGAFSNTWENTVVLSDKSAGTITFDYELTEGFSFGIRTVAHNSQYQSGWAGFNQITQNNTGGAISSKASGNTNPNMYCTKTGRYRFTFTLDNAGLISSVVIDTVI